MPRTMLDTAFISAPCNISTLPATCVASSAKLVPIESMVKPIKNSEIPIDLATFLLLLTITSADRITKNKNTNPKMISLIISNHPLLQSFLGNISSNQAHKTMLFS